MFKKKIILILFILLISFNYIYSQTALAAGDIAFIGLNSDGSDDFSFVILKDIESGTTISITDKGWNDGPPGSFYFDPELPVDEVITWAATSNMNAGDMVNIRTATSGGAIMTPDVADVGMVTGGTLLSYAGDQIFIFQGNESDPTFITGIHWNVEVGTSTSTNWDGSATSVKTSALPNDLTNGINAIWLYAPGPTERDNFRYKSSATSTGSAADLSEAINNVGNWDVDSTNNTPYLWNPSYLSFTVEVTAVVPTVTTTSATSVTTNSASSGGNVTDDGGASVTARGACWSTSSNPTTADSYTTNGSGTGSYSSSITSLSHNTLYHYRAYATNSVGTSYGSDLSFTTVASPPTTTTNAATNINTVGATLNGTVNANGVSTTVTFEYGLDTNYGSIATPSQSPVSGTSATPVSDGISGLSVGTTYHYRVKAVSSGGTTYGSDVSFTTDATSPTVTTTTASSLAQDSASSGGNVTNDGGASVTARGACWSTSVNPTIADSYTTDGSGTGSYSSSITSLSPNTLYHYRAYATNSAGTGYGTDLNFTTLPGEATNIFPSNSSTNMPRLVTVNWRCNGVGTPTGFKVFQDGSQVGSNILWSGDILYNKDLAQAVWGATVNWKIVPYNGSGDCASPTQWSFTVMTEPADPAEEPAEVVYCEEAGYSGDNPDPLILPDIDLGNGDVNPTLDFGYGSPVTDFTVFAEVCDQPNNPIPNPVNCGAAFRTNLPTAVSTTVSFSFGGAQTPDQIMRWNGSEWENITTSSGATFGIGTVYFSWTSGVRGEEEFTVNNGDGALPVTLSSFTGTFSNGSSLLQWTTQSESNNLGWNVYRSETENAEEFMLLNANMIEGAGTTSEQTDYAFADGHETYPTMTYWYWIENVDNSGFTSLHGPVQVIIPDNEDEENPPELAEIYGLAQNYPNPFNPNTKIAFKLSSEDAENASIVIYNCKGEIVKTLNNLVTNENEIGFAEWDGKDMNGNMASSGIYLYKMKTSSGYTSTKKMIIMK